MSSSSNQGTLDIFVTRNQLTLPEEVVTRNREADQKDTAWSDLQVSLGFGDAATLHDRILFPRRRWAEVTPAPKDPAAARFVTIDNGPIRCLTHGQANRLHAKLSSSTHFERLQTLTGLPLIAVQEWLCDPLEGGWFYVDTSTRATFWICTPEELQTIYGKTLCESETVISCQNRCIVDWVERKPSSQELTQSKYEVFPAGITIFPAEPAKAMLFDRAAQCLNCLRDDELPKTKDLRKFARRSLLDVETVLGEAYDAGHILHDDIVLLSIYLEQDDIERKDYQRVAQVSDDPETAAEDEELEFLYGYPRGRRQLFLDRQKVKGLRFKLDSIPEDKMADAAGHGATYWQLARAYKGRAPRTGRELRRTALSLFGCHGPEHTAATIAARDSKGKLEVVRDWVDEVKCIECKRFRLVDSWIPENKLTTFNCVKMRDFLIQPFSCGDDLDQRLRHFTWCPADCQQHLVWLARKRARSCKYVFA